MEKQSNQNFEYNLFLKKLMSFLCHYVDFSKELTEKTDPKKKESLEKSLLSAIQILSESIKDSATKFKEELNHLLILLAKIKEYKHSRFEREMEDFLDYLENHFDEIKKIWNEKAEIMSLLSTAEASKLSHHFTTLSIEQYLKKNTSITEEAQQQTENLSEATQEHHRIIQSYLARASLTKGYRKAKNLHTLMYLFWVFIIIFGLFAMFQLSDFSDINLLGFLHDRFIKHENSTQTQSINEYAFNYLKKLPAYLALVWLIIFSSRRANEANRLASDYEHKEVYASSYEAFLDEIKKLKYMKIISKEKEKETEELATKLLDSMIGVLSDNPAKSLDTKKTTDELPAKEIINLASEIIKFKGKNT